MSLQIPTIYLLLGAVLAFVLSHVVKFYSTSHALRDIPTIGSRSSSILSFYSNSLKFILDSRRILREGHQKVRLDGFIMFKSLLCSTVVLLSKWHL